MRWEESNTGNFDHESSDLSIRPGPVSFLKCFFTSEFCRLFKVRHDKRAIIMTSIEHMGKSFWLARISNPWSWDVCLNRSNNLLTQYYIFSRYSGTSYTDMSVSSYPAITTLRRVGVGYKWGFKGLHPTPTPPKTDTSYTGTSYTGTSYTNTSYTNTPYPDPSNNNTSYTDTSYTGTSYTDTPYTDTSYIDTSYTDTLLMCPYRRQGDVSVGSVCVIGVIVGNTVAKFYNNMSLYEF